MIEPIVITSPAQLPPVWTRGIVAATFEAALADQPLGLSAAAGLPGLAQAGRAGVRFLCTAVIKKELPAQLLQGIQA